MNGEYLPIVLMLVCFCIIAGLFIALVVFLVLKGRNKAWTGKIIDKSTSEFEDMDSGRESTIYSIKIKSDEGKEFKIQVDSKKYKDYKIGDKLKKESGKIWPEKV